METINRIFSRNQWKNTQCLSHQYFDKEQGTMRLRTIKQCYEQIKALDNDSAITVYFIRTFMFSK